MKIGPNGAYTLPAASAKLGAYGTPMTPSALVLATEQRITYISRTNNEPYPGTVVSVSSDAVHIQLDGVAGPKAVGPDDFWRISSTPNGRGSPGCNILVFKTGQSVQYKSKSNGQSYLGTVSGPAASGGVQLMLQGAAAAKEIAAHDSDIAQWEADKAAATKQREEANAVF